MQLEILGFILLITVLNIFASLFKSKRSNILACGLVGYSGINNFNTLHIQLLLYWNSIERKSTDSTGIYTPKSGLHKNNVRAELFITDQKDISKLQEDNVLVGHVRAKTFGANTIKNSHPFEYGDLIGAHNGTLKNHIKLAVENNISVMDYDVDSQVLFNVLSMNFASSTDDNFKVLSEYEGAAALLFYNKQEEVLYACHDSERPLFYGMLNETDMYISSEKAPLEVIKCTDIKAFPINKVHKIKHGAIIDTYDYTKYIAPIKKSTDVRVALASDIKWADKYMYFSQNIFKGIVASQVNTFMLIGYWLRCDNARAGDEANMKLNDWYYCYWSKAGKLHVRDMDGEKYQCEIRHLDTTNFIPVKDMYVKLTTNLVSTKDPNLSLGSKDSVWLVKGEYSYSDDTVEIYNPITKKNMIADCKFVRNISPKENDEYVAFLKQYEDTVKEKLVKDTINLNKLIELEKDDLPFKDEEDIKTPLLLPAVVNTVEEIDDDENYLPASIFYKSLDAIRSKLELIDDQLDKYQVTDAKNGIENLLDEIGKSYEISYIENQI